MYEHRPWLRTAFVTTCGSGKSFVCSTKAIYAIGPLLRKLYLKTPVLSYICEKVLLSAYFSRLLEDNFMILAPISFCENILQLAEANIRYWRCASFTDKYDLACRFFSRPTHVFPPAFCLLAISYSTMSHRARGGDNSPEPCYGNATRRCSKGARKPAEGSDPKTAFSMLWHNMYPHVIVSLEPGDAVVVWRDVVYSEVADKDNCNYKCFISVRPECL
jgi:hypothetical protein